MKSIFELRFWFEIILNFLILISNQLFGDFDDFRQTLSARLSVCGVNIIPQDKKYANLMSLSQKLE